MTIEMIADAAQKIKKKYHGILQARILEWVAIAFSRDLPDPGIEPEPLTSPALKAGFFTTSATWEALSIS